MENKSKRDEIIEVVNKLFIYTDTRQWSRLQEDVFTPIVQFDRGLEGIVGLSGTDIARLWDEGFRDLGAIHHQAGNYLVNFGHESIEADVFCYAVAYHFTKKDPVEKLREFIGQYNLHVVLTDLGWRIDSFKYTLTYRSPDATTV
jgi:hypothetical protein